VPPAPKKVPVEVVERARTLALTKQYTVAPEAKAPTLKTSAEKKKKVVAALKRLHPMD
jgi:hypothetical protein